MRIGIILVTSNPILKDEISDICSKKGNISILESLTNSEGLLQSITRLRPKVILLTDDLNEEPLPIIAKVMQEIPTPLLFIKTKPSLEIDTDHTYTLEYGIVDVIEIEIINDKVQFPQIIPIRISILSKLKLDRFLGQIEQVNQYKSSMRMQKSIVTSDIFDSDEQNQDEEKLALRESIFQSKFYGNKIITIAASTGGPTMIVNLLSKLPSHFPPILVIQHMPEGFLQAFAARIDSNTRMKAKLAKEGDEIKADTIYVAPGGKHLELERTQGGRVIVHTTIGEKVNFVRPAADITLKSVSKIYGENAIAVILTGMGVDGKAGCTAIKQNNGKVIALSEQDSIIYGMNKAIIEAGLADHILSLDQIPIRIRKILENN